MEDKRIDLLVEMTTDMREDITAIKVALAEKKGERKAFGSIGTWVNTAGLFLLAFWQALKN